MQGSARGGILFDIDFDIDIDQTFYIDIDSISISRGTENTNAWFVY